VFASACGGDDSRFFSRRGGKTLSESVRPQEERRIRRRRVMGMLADDSFVSGAPYTKAGWIVVPFHFTAEPKQSGVTCISSL